MNNGRQRVTQKEIKAIIDNMRDTATAAATTIRRLQDNGTICKDKCLSSYTYNLRKTKEYYLVLNDIKDLKKKRDMMLLDMKYEGMTYRQISNKTGLSYDTIYSTFLRYGKVKKIIITTRGEGKKSQKKLVEDWNKNYYPGRVPTLQTRKAFEALNLELKC